MDKLSQEEIQGIVFNAIGEDLRDDFERRFLSGRKFHTGDEPFDEAEIYSCLSSDSQEELVKMDYSSQYEWVDEILAERGIALHKNSVEYQALARLRLASVAVILEIIAHRYVGDFDYEKKELLKFKPENLLAFSKVNQECPEQKASVYSPPLSDVLDKYIHEKASTGSWATSSTKDIIPTLKQFLEIVGDKGCLELEKRHVRDYREKVLSLPARYQTSKVYRGLTIEEILERSSEDDPRPSNNTLNNKFIKVKGFLSWIENQGYSEKQGLGKTLGSIKTSMQRGRAKALFTEEERLKIFSPDNLCGKYVKNPFQFWIPLLGLYTGARIEELCQLHVEDIRQEDGVWHLDINDKGKKHVKTSASIRKVPLHPGLLNDLGFLAFVDAKKLMGEERLFPELELVERTGKVSDRASKWFSRYLERVGVKTHGSKEKTCFHSLRGTFTNYCKQNGMEDKKVKEVVGHAHEGDITEAHYNAPYGLEILLRDVVGRVDFGIDLQGLGVSPYAFPTS